MNNSTSIVTHYLIQVVMIPGEPILSGFLQFRQEMKIKWLHIHMLSHSSHISIKH